MTDTKPKPSTALEKAQLARAIADAKKARVDADVAEHAAQVPDPLAPKTKPKSLTPKKMLAIAALVSGENKTQAAKAAGVGASTLRTWCRADVAFIAELEQAREAALGSARERLEAIGPAAVGTLEGLLKSKNEKIRLGAASKALELLFRPERAASSTTNIAIAAVAAGDYAGARADVEALAGNREAQVLAGELLRQIGESASNKDGNGAG